MSLTSNLAVLSRRVLLLVSVAALAGCVHSRITGRTMGPAPAEPLTQFTVVLNDARFTDVNTATLISNKDLDALMPALERRLPVVFGANALFAKTIRVKPERTNTGYKLSRPAEATGDIITITPQQSTYSSKSGSSLTLGVVVTGRERLAPVWVGSLRLATLGGGSYGDDLADTVGKKLLAELRDSKMIALAGSEVLDPPKPGAQTVDAGKSAADSTPKAN